jgi:hypothetical protein
VLAVVDRESVFEPGVAKPSIEWNDDCEVIDTVSSNCQFISSGSISEEVGDEEAGEKVPSGLADNEPEFIVRSDLDDGNLLSSGFSSLSSFAVDFALSPPPTARELIDSVSSSLGSGSILMA